MNIWVVSVYGEVPSDGWRGYPPGVVSEVLSGMGHQVTWWTANFSHHCKTYRCRGWGRVEVNPNYEIRLVPTPSYRHNIGLARVGFELAFAWRLYRRARAGPPPDVVLATEPPQSNALAAARLARRFRVPLVLHLNDLWPELFAIALPGWLRPAARLIFLPFHALRKMAFRCADGVAAVSESYLELARRQAPRLAPARFVTAYNACDTATRPRHRPATEEAERLARYFNKPAEEVWAVYAGGLGHNYDIRTLLEASLRLAAMRPPVRIIVAGAGPASDAVLSFTQQHQEARLRFLGKLSPPELDTLYRLCEVGISAYVPGSTVTMPVKAFDYMAAGLPIVNSLPGELAELLQRRRLGVYYRAGDPAALVSALTSLAADPAARAEMSANCLALAPEFDCRRQYAKIARLLEAVVEADRSRPFAATCRHAAGEAAPELPCRHQ